MFLMLSVLSACSKDSEESSGTRAVAYKAVIDRADGDADLILKGEYIDRQGKAVKVDGKLPFTISLSDVPATTKPAFKGYIFSIKASRLVGEIVMEVRDSRGKAVYTDSKKIDLSTTRPTGFSSDELARETSFSFSAQ